MIGKIKITESEHQCIRLEKPAKLFFVFLAFLLLLPLVWGGFCTDHRERENFEKRHLARFPAATELRDPKKYFTDIEAYISDHVGFAVAFNRFYRKMSYYLFRASTVKNISITKSGFVFLTSHSAEKANEGIEVLCIPDASEAARQEAWSNLMRINRAVTSFGHRAIFASAISKPVLYPEHLPGDISAATRKRCHQFYGENNLLRFLKRKAVSEGLIFHYPLERFRQAKTDPHFYPKENFHWHGLSAHVFARTFFERLGLSVPPYFDDGRELIAADADLHSLGFTRKIKVWAFSYPEFWISGGFLDKRLDYLKPYYERMIDYSFYTTERPLMDKDAILFSYSFGKNTAKHLAVGYKTLTQINVNFLQENETERFFEKMLSLHREMDVIFFFFDASMIPGDPLRRFAGTFSHLGKKAG